MTRKTYPYKGKDYLFAELFDLPECVLPKNRRSSRVLWNRLNSSHMPIEKALTTPIGKYKPVPPKKDKKPMTAEERAYWDEWIQKPYKEIEKNCLKYWDGKKMVGLEDLVTKGKK